MRRAASLTVLVCVVCVLWVFFSSSSVPRGAGPLRSRSLFAGPQRCKVGGFNPFCLTAGSSLNNGGRAGPSAAPFHFCPLQIVALASGVRRDGGANSERSHQ